MFILIHCIGFKGSAQQAEVLTNESIIEMYNKKLPNSILLAKIKASQNNFDVSTDAIILLIEKKLPEDIVNVMIEAANDNTRHLVKIDPNNPMDMHDTGIYYFKKDSEIPELIQLEPTVYSQNKSKGGLASAFTYGLAKVKAAVTLDGSQAQFQITEKQPEFYFYFDNSAPSNQNSNWWFTTATSPNEFLLVALSLNKETREVTTGSANITGSSSGVDDKNRADFRVEKMAQGIYRVYFETPISGEYCFMYAGSVPTGYTTLNKVYDFGIK